jgi:hypothetical protein
MNEEQRQRLEVILVDRRLNLLGDDREYVSQLAEKLSKATD